MQSRRAFRSTLAILFVPTVAFHARAANPERVALREGFDAPGVVDDQFIDQAPLAGWRHTRGQVRVGRRTGFGDGTCAIRGRGVPHWGGRAERPFEAPMPWSRRYVLKFQAFAAWELEVENKKLTTQNDYFGFSGCGSMDGPYWYCSKGTWAFDARAVDGESRWQPPDQEDALNRVVDCEIVWDVAARQCWGRMEYQSEGKQRVIESPRVAIPWNRLYEIRAVCAYCNGYNTGEN